MRCVGLHSLIQSHIQLERNLVCTEAENSAILFFAIVKRFGLIWRLRCTTSVHKQVAKLSHAVSFADNVDSAVAIRHSRVPEGISVLAACVCVPVCEGIDIYSLI